MFEEKLWNAACRRRHQIHQPFWTDYSPPSSDWLEPQHGHYGECLQWPQVFAHSKPKLSETSETVRLCEISMFWCIQMYCQCTKNNALGAGAWVSNYLSVYLSIDRSIDLWIYRSIYGSIDLSNLSCPVVSYLSYLSFLSYLPYPSIPSIRSILSILPILIYLVYLVYLVYLRYLIYPIYPVHLISLMSLINPINPIILIYLI